jgi:hypothetical protein
MTVLSDVIQRKKATIEEILANPISYDLIKSNIAIRDPKVSALVKNGYKGSKLLIPFTGYQELTEGFYSEGGTGGEIPVSGYSMGEMTVQIHTIAKAYGYAEIVDIAASKVKDSVEYLLNQVAEWRNFELKNRLLSSLAGAAASVEVNNNSDVIYDTDNVFSRDEFIEALYLLGDHYKNVDTIVVHSAIKKIMDKENAVSTIRDSDNNLITEMYDGYKLIVDDDITVDANGKYSCLLLQKGALIYENVDLGKPVLAYVKEEAKDNGHGVETIIFRQRYVLHVNGFSYTGVNQAKETPSFAELKDSANWKRIVKGKQSPFVIMKVKAA